MLVHDYLERSADRLPDKTALVCGTRRLSYAEIDTMADRLATTLRRAGVCRGDRVVITLPNTPEAVVSLFATLKADAAFVMVNPTTKADKLAYIVQNCRPSALITEAGQAVAVEEAKAACPSVRCHLVVGDGYAEQAAMSWEDGVAAGDPKRPARHAIDLDLAALIYTSGSTGRPKGVMATHLNMVTAAISITTYLESRPDDVVLNVLPLSFDYGLYQVLMAARVGATLVLERNVAYPQMLVDRMASEAVTGLPGVPTLFALLLQLSGFERHPLPHLRYMTNTGAALPVEHIRRLRAAFPHARLYSMYGLTECKRVSYLPPEEVDRRPRSVGIAIPNTEVWIEDAQGNRLGPGQVGELVVRGAHVTRGYWEDPEATMRTFGPGPLPGETVLYTGDLFTMDAEGYLYFVGRQDDIIKTRGEKVSPREVENVLYALPETVEAAVIGVPDPILGQAIKAYIVPRDGSRLTPQDVIRHCRRHLEDHMIPSQITFCATLPKTESGKIHMARLREEAQQND
ncbi:MAG TPA: AMP-binding protein [Chloroflexi bacterium]|jgi:long-chain acyl-CoA synthetase|nr:AMP-binding protein [Chloroflexota bacterium]